MKRLLKASLVTLLAVAIGVFGTQPAFADWLSTGNTNDSITSGFTGLANLKNLKETSSLIASRTYPGWYYTASDRYKDADDYTACASLSGTAETNCIKGERAKVWMLHVDASTRKIDSARAFPISNASWSQDSAIALNGDWEDMTHGPVRVLGGVSTNTIEIAATGKDTGAGNCSARRIIEFNELNPNAPAGTTWSPSIIFDLDGSTIADHQSDCNIEAAYLGQESSPSYLYLVSYGTVNGVPGASSVFKRVLTPSTGRQNVAGSISNTIDIPSASEFQYVGSVRAPAGTFVQPSGAAFQASNDDVTLVDTNGGCRLLRWHSRAFITTTEPEVFSVCSSGTSGVTAEGISYTYSTDPAVRSMHVIYDETTDTSMLHKFFPWQ